MSVVGTPAGLPPCDAALAIFAPYLRTSGVRGEERAIFKRIDISDHAPVLIHLDHSHATADAASSADNLL